jgi:lysophospholipase L1-like esterase
VDVWESFEAYGGVESQHTDELLLDQVHPNDAGHQLIAELLSQEILSLVEPVTE